MPNRPRIVTLYTAVATAAPAPTTAPATATSVMPDAIETANDHRCSHPRMRGLTGGAGCEETVPAGTLRGYGTLRPIRAIRLGCARPRGGARRRLTRRGRSRPALC